MSFISRIFPSSAANGSTGSSSKSFRKLEKQADAWSERLRSQPGGRISAELAQEANTFVRFAQADLQGLLASNQVTQAEATAFETRLNALQDTLEAVLGGQQAQAVGQRRGEDLERRVSAIENRCDELREAMASLGGGPERRVDNFIHGSEITDYEFRRIATMEKVQVFVPDALQVLKGIGPSLVAQGVRTQAEVTSLEASLRSLMIGVGRLPGTSIEEDSGKPVLVLTHGQPKPESWQ